MTTRKCYPKELFSINEERTRRNLEEYDRKREKWYQKAVELYPNYWHYTLMEQWKLRRTIDEAVGFSL